MRASRGRVRGDEETTTVKKMIPMQSRHHVGVDGPGLQASRLAGALRVSCARPGHPQNPQKPLLPRLATLFCGSCGKRAGANRKNDARSARTDRWPVRGGDLRKK